tara:strand:+ start:38 stop:322 length:285 start_codon:yes stop_codon:yes gene_type:complete
MNDFIDKYVDEDGNVDNELSLNSDGFISLTENLEEIINKFTGSERWQENNHFFDIRSQIRSDLMDLIHDIVNKKEINNKCLTKDERREYDGKSI